MRTLFLIFFVLSYLMLTMGVIILFAGYSNPEHFQIKNFNWTLMAWSAGIGIISALMLAFHLSSYFGNNLWKAQKELDDKRIEYHQKSKHLDNVIKVMGEHEAIKLWEKEKLKEKENEKTN